jgi:hypothetical protein
VNQGRALLRFITAHPPQALKDLFCEVDLQWCLRAKLLNGRKKTTLIDLLRLTRHDLHHAQ